MQARDAFLAFDSKFPLLIAGVPPGMLGVGAAIQHLRRCFSAAVLSGDVAHIVEFRQTWLHENFTVGSDQSLFNKRLNGECVPEPRAFDVLACVVLSCDLLPADPYANRRMLHLVPRHECVPACLPVGHCGQHDADRVLGNLLGGQDPGGPRTVCGRGERGVGGDRRRRSDLDCAHTDARDRRGGLGGGCGRVGGSVMGNGG